MHFIGIDIGSTSSKVAVMDERGEFCELFLLPSGFSAVKVARQIKQALEQKGYAEGFVTATGYGRVSVDYAQLSMSEILCHGLGAHFLFEPDCTVIDVGGQDTKAIKIENGKPTDFIMNDKCSAGTGKFLEISAGRLGLELSEIYKTARKNPAIKLSSTCTVFAESEIVSLSANGAETSEIAYAIVDSSAHKVAALIKRLENQIYFLSGGLSNVPLFKQLLGEHLGAEIFTHENAIYCGAMGASLIGARKANEIFKGDEMKMDFDALKKRNAMALHDLKEQGKHVVGMFCTYSPKELIYAAGAVPVGLCAYDESPIDAAHAELPRNLCPLIKASYGYAVTKKCPYMNASDLVIGETTCDGKKKMYELLAKHKDVHVLQLPNMTGGKSLELFTDELREFRKVLEQKFDTKITDEALLDAVQIYNEERKVMLELLELGKLNPMPVAGSEIHQISFASDFIYDKREKLKMIRAYIAAAKEITPPKTRKKRIIITGCPSGGVYEKVIKQIEELGADVVAFENCSGTKGYQNQVQTKGDLVANIAERYLKIPCSVMYQNDARSEVIKDFVREYQADGVIDVVLSGCHTYAIETNRIKEASREAGANYMSLETDYSKQDVGQIRTRLEAFIELL